MIMSGAQAVVACLAEQGVEVVFGYPGGQNLPLYDALYDAPFAHVLTVHEQGAAHAADGYARASGKVGVCIATSGPGATNLITGLATANMDSSPIVAITGQVSSSLLGRDAFQEVDIIGATIPVIKHSFLVLDITKLPSIIRQAFHIARSGRPGPVLIDIPRDIQIGMLDFQPGPTVGESVAAPGKSQLRDNEAQIRAAVAALCSARQPVMIVGGGAVAAAVSDELVAFAEKCALPVVSTLMGLGAFPGSNKHFLGLTGMHGLKPANKAIYNADLIIAVGSRFSDRITGDRSKYITGKTVIHIDVDPAEIDKNIMADIGITGDMRNVLNRLIDSTPAAFLPSWWESIRNWQKTYVVTPDADTLTASLLMRQVNQAVINDNCIFVTDVGQHQMWAAQNLSVEKPRHWLTSGGLGTMGFGLPAAIGAQFAREGNRVVLFAGDGGFKMTGIELYTAVTQGLPIIAIVVNNHSLGMVRQWQQLFFKQRYSSSLFEREFDFAGFATACGAWSAAVSTPDEFERAFAEALLQTNRPSVIVADIARSDLVTPMIAPGAALDDYVEVN